MVISARSCSSCGSALGRHWPVSVCVCRGQSWWELERNESNYPMAGQVCRQRRSPVHGIHASTAPGPGPRPAPTSAGRPKASRCECSIHRSAGGAALKPQPRSLHWGPGRCGRCRMWEGAGRITWRAYESTKCCPPPLPGPPAEF